MSNSSNPSADRPDADDRSPPSAEGASADGARVVTCPGGEELRQGYLGALPRPSQANFERHLLNCSLCQARINGLEARDSFVDAIRKKAVYGARLQSDRDTTAYFNSQPTAQRASQPVCEPFAEFAGNERFRIDRRLGAGGMGIVYQAYDRHRRETIALKTLRRLGERAALRLTQEFRALADLRHRNLVSLYELHAEGDRRFFTMELLDGQDFLANVRGGDANGSAEAECFDRLRRCLIQLATGLQALHAAGKLHRDIKPSNVLIARGERLALVDFGLAADLAADAEDENFVAGTAAYMSPEQAAGKRLTPASDWYSVGVMLFEALTGELPFTGRPRDVMARKQVEEPLPLDYWARELPADLQTLCAELLRVRPEERPDSDEIMARLGGAAGVMPAPSANFAAPVSVRAASAVATRDAGSAGSCFVGREAELAELHAAYDRVAQGAAAAVLVRGAPGIGKTALCAQFLEEAVERRSAIVLAGRCYERELVPYKAAESCMESLVRYLRRQPEPEILAWRPPGLAAAVRMFPILRSVAAIEALASDGQPAPSDPADQKRQAFGALRDLLRRIGERSPLIIFIDDLQWGDADSPALFAECLRGPNAPRILLAGACREEAGATGPWLSAWLEIERKSGFAWTSQELRIGGLPIGAARQLALRLSRAMQDLDDEESRAEALARRAMGHPLFLRELAEQAATPGRSGSDRSAASAPELPTLPDLVWQRIAALDAEAYRLLETVAAAGYPLSLERAHRAASLDLGRRAPLEALLAANLVRMTRDEPLGKLVAYHDLVRETLLSRSNPQAILDAHRRLAAAVASETPTDEESLVLHYQGAGHSELAVRHAVAAADRAAASLAFDSAIRCYRLALESPGWSDDQRGSLRAKLADALANAGRSQEAGAEYQQLAQSAVDETRRRDFRSKSGQHFMRAGLIDGALTVFDPIFRELGLSLPPASQGRLLGSILCRRAWLEVTGYRPRRFLNRPANQRLLDQIDLCSLVGGALSCFDFLRGTELLLRSSQLALRSGDASRVALALAKEACISGMCGKRERANKFILRAENLARRTGNDHALGGVIFARGICHMMAGEWAPSLEACDSMKDVLRRFRGNRFETMQAEWLSHHSLFYSGQLRSLAERVSDRLQDAIEQQDRYATALFRLNMANLAWLAIDRPDEACRQVDEALRPWAELPPMIRYYAMASQLRIDLYQGQGTAAWQRLQDQWPWLTRSGLLQTRFVSIEAHYLRARCALAGLGLAKSRPTAMRLLRQSIRFLERQGWGWSTALASLARAGMLAANGESAAIEAHRAAQQQFVDARMPLHAAAAQRRLGELSNDERLIAESDAALFDHGAANPRGFAAMLTGIPPQV